MPRRKQMKKENHKTVGSDALVNAHCPVNGPNMGSEAAGSKTDAAVRRISSLADHRALLKEVFASAKKRIIVVSPFVSKSALKYDNIPSMIRDAVARGVSVTIYTDSKLNQDENGKTKVSAAEGVRLMQEAGAKVHVSLKGIRHKTLIKDNSLIAEGSFNWLSAARTEKVERQREEKTMVVEGGQAENLIKNETLSLAENINQVINHKAPHYGEPINIGCQRTQYKKTTTKHNNKTMIAFMGVLAATAASVALAGFNGLLPTKVMIEWILAIAGIFIVLLIAPLFVRGQKKPTYKNKNYSSPIQNKSAESDVFFYAYDESTPEGQAGQV